MYESKRRPPKRKAEEGPTPIPPRTEEEAIKRAGGYAMDLAMKQLREGTASSQIIVHFLRLNSPKEQAELEKTRKEIEVLEAKKQTLISQEEQDKKYEEVIKAFTSYAGKDSDWETVEEDYPEYEP